MKGTTKKNFGKSGRSGAVLTLAGLFIMAMALVFGFAACDNGTGGGGNEEPVITAVESGAFTSAVGNNKLVITLTGGTFAASPVIGQFTISTAGTGGFANLTGGTVTRDSATQVTITGLTAVTTAGSGQKITVAAAAQATQATSVSVEPWGDVTSVEQLDGTWKGSYLFLTEEVTDGITMTITVEITLVINASAETGTMTSATTMAFSGESLTDAVWEEYVKPPATEGLEEGTYTVDDDAHSITQTETQDMESITVSGLGLQINQNGTRVQMPAGTMGEESPAMTFVKQ
ncbi:MAG: hypothetical protein MdMp014T_1238 [Treponematales bacterium]